MWRAHRHMQVWNKLSVLFPALTGPSSPLAPHIRGLCLTVTWSSRLPPLPPPLPTPLKRALSHWNMVSSPPPPPTSEGSVSLEHGASYVRQAGSDGL